MNHTLRRRLACALSFVLCASVLLSCVSCTGNDPAAELGLQSLSANSGENVLHAAVLYCGSDNDGTWQDTLSHLQQAVVLGFDAVAVDMSGEWSLAGYDALYLDASLKNGTSWANVIADFAAAGGGVFVPNELWDYFDPAVLGAESFQKIEDCPAEGMEYPAVGEDLRPIQELVEDFAGLYAEYKDYPALKENDYGYGMAPSTAEALAERNGLAVYALNRWGEGHVLFTNALLPNPFFITGLAMEAREGQTAFSSATASCNQLMVNEFMAYLARQRWGFSLSKVYGSYGRPGMSWELHYEELTGIANGAAELFAEAAMDASQVPSYTLVRNSMAWWTRSESVTYLLGKPGGRYAYGLDSSESAYGSGTHVAAGETWLSLADIPDAGGYFESYPQYDQRAYPCACDWNGDGKVDLLCGSSDGLLYYFEGVGFDDRLTTKEAVLLKDVLGKPLTVGSYSAPVLTEVNGDGIPDVVCGAGDGRVYWFAGNEDGTFSARRQLCSARMGGQALPEVGDLNNDGCPDLVIGSNTRRLEVWYGNRTDRLSVGGRRTVITVPEEETGSFLAPRVVDWDGDGKNDLAVGTFAGYIMKLKTVDGALRFDGYLANTAANYHGNDLLMFQNNCVPVFYDLNGDGVIDLLIGSLEYGIAYPIDSPYFPHREELQKTVDFAKERGFYLGLHVMTGRYATVEAEVAELSAQKWALQSYGIDTETVGANRHTWYSSTASPSQTFRSEWRAGLLWDSGFSPARASQGTPQVSPENAVVYPFFLLDEDKQTILVQNCSTVLYRDDTYALLSGKYEMPACLFYHMDLNYKDPEENAKVIGQAEAFRRAFDYNFVGEHQQMKASAAAIHMTAKLTPAKGQKGFSFAVAAGDDSMAYPLKDARYANACGVKVTFGEKLAGKTFATDADVWYWGENGCLYVGLNKTVRVYETEEAETVPHIQQINIPAEITPAKNGAKVAFSDGGMMQLTVAGDAATDSEGWTVEEIDGNTRFTKYGEADTLNLHYSAE